IGLSAILSNIGSHKLPAMTPVGVLNVAWVNVDAQVFGINEILRVRARPAADIQNPSHLCQVIWLEDGREFLVGKERLAESVSPGLFKESFCQRVHDIGLLPSTQGVCNINVSSAPSASRG